MKYLTFADPETVNRVIDLLELAFIKACINKDKLPDLCPYISFREAAKKYGAGTVRGWKDAGLIKFIQDKSGGKIRIDRLKIEVVSKASNRGI